MVNKYRQDKLPESSNSYWTNYDELPNFPKLNTDIHVDAVIVGGGITGITTAYLLTNAGLKVALLESDRLLNGTTGHTTAKITAQHDLIYDELIRNIGIDRAGMYYESNMEALNFIKKTIELHEIDCDFSPQDAWLYATTEKYQEKIEKEAIAYEKLNIKGSLVDSIPFGIEVKNALIMSNQAQFHPVKYLTALVKQIISKGAQIFEQTTAVDVKTRIQPTVYTSEKFSVTADYILACSHFPFYEGIGLYSARMHAERSYIIAAKSNVKYPGGMYLSADEPKRSLRSVTINDEEMILIGGESHKTGQSEDTLKHYEALEVFGKHHLGLEVSSHRWSAQDLITIDKVPYVGKITQGQDRILIATSYRKWGMTNGTHAAILLSDLVLKRKNNYQDLYRPSRFYPIPSIKNLIVQNANVVEQLIKGKLQLSHITTESIANDEAVAILTIDGERKGAYKDKEGKIHIVDTTCTHIGCEVDWNSGERSWDCPCHGSRFSYTGEVLEGPAEKPLQKYDYKMIDNLTSDDSGY